MLTTFYSVLCLNAHFHHPQECLIDPDKNISEIVVIMCETLLLIAHFYHPQECLIDPVRDLLDDECDAAETLGHASELLEEIEDQSLTLQKLLYEALAVCRTMAAFYMTNHSYTLARPFPKYNISLSTFYSRNQMHSARSIETATYVYIHINI